MKDVMHVPNNSKHVIKEDKASVGKLVQSSVGKVTLPVKCEGAKSFCHFFPVLSEHLNTLVSVNFLLRVRIA